MDLLASGVGDKNDSILVVRLLTVSFNLLIS